MDQDSIHIFIGDLDINIDNCPLKQLLYPTLVGLGRCCERRVTWATLKPWAVFNLCVIISSHIAPIPDSFQQHIMLVRKSDKMGGSWVLIDVGYVAM